MANNATDQVDVLHQDRTGVAGGYGALIIIDRVSKIVRNFFCPMQKAVCHLYVYHDTSEVKIEP